MKQNLLVVFAIFFAISSFGQVDWTQYQKKKGGGNLQPIGLLVAMNGGFIGSRADLNPIAEGDIDLGVFIGRGSVSFLMVANFASHSEVINYIAPDIDPVCGCYRETNIRDFQNYLQISSFQLGFAYQTKGITFSATAGIGGVQRSFPVADSLGMVVMQNGLRQTSPVVSAQIRTLIGRDLLTARITSVADVRYPVAKASLSYLLRFNGETDIFGGVRGGYISHEVSGYEFTLGPELFLGSGDNIPMDMWLSFGAAYNPNPNEGFGLYVSAGIGLSRQNKFLFH